MAHSHLPYNSNHLLGAGDASGLVSTDPHLQYLYRQQISLVRSLVTYTREGAVVELGGAGANPKALWPEVVVTDVREGEGVDRVMGGETIEWPAESVAVLFSLNGFHHFRDPEAHFRELQRVLVPGGNESLIEPNWNRWSRFFLHAASRGIGEPYDVTVREWRLPSDDPMLGNQAQSYNIFIRDRERFERQYPDLQVDIGPVTKGTAFHLSGGVHHRSRIPGTWLIKLERVEYRLPVLRDRIALARAIRITKRKPA